jgi:hypothetical protein
MFQMATRVFTAFDYDHDEFLRTALAGQSKHEDSPFEICDYSVKEPFTGDWKKKVRERIKKCGLMVVMCGEYTHTSTGVNAELEIAQEEGIPYFLLAGYSNKTCTKPKAAKSTDKLYKWTWDNLKKLIKGDR